MLGHHPYDFVGGGAAVENLRGGHFPCGIVVLSNLSMD
jgi:hypothetical protein